MIFVGFFIAMIQEAHDATENKKKKKEEPQNQLEFYLKQRMMASLNFTEMAISPELKGIDHGVQLQKFPLAQGWSSGVRQH